MLEGNPKADRDRFHLREEVIQDYCFIAPEGITPENLEKSDFWSIVCNILKPMGHIAVYAEDGTWEAECTILNVGPTWAAVKVLNVHWFVPTEKPKDAPLDFKVFWRGRHHRWAVKRMSDGHIIENDLGSKQMADKALAEHRKAILL